MRGGDTEIQLGDVLRGKYVIERLIGEGGMGKVYLAVDRDAEQSNPFVALKMLGDQFKEHPQSLKALRREATQSRQLSHPNIVNVYGFDRADSHVFMVMEYMQGVSFEEFLQKHPRGSSLTEAWRVIEASGQALQYLHEHHIVHSDFKPSNVFLTHEGEIKVLDLGIARSLDETQAAAGTTRFDPDALGAMTPQYASCEMFEGMTPTAQDDLFALACVAYETLTGAHPYQRKMAIEARSERIAPEKPRGLKKRQWRALRAALAYSRADRPTSVAEFLEAFSPETKKGSPVPWIGATVLAVLAGAALVVFQMRSADDRFRESLLDVYAENPDQPVPGGKAEEWLKQGDFFLDLGKRSMEIGEYDRGASQLFTGPSSAFQSYRLVLTRTDEADAKMVAVDGMLRISQVFRDAAENRVEQQSDIETTARLVCQGLQVNRFEPVLEALLKELNEQLPRGVSVVSDCRELVTSGKVKL